MSESAAGAPILYLYRLKPGAGAEYDRRHAKVWPELLDEIRRAGIRDYSIYRHDEIVVCRLTADQGLAVANKRLTTGDVQRRWTASLAGLFESTADVNGEPLWLTEVFRLD